MGLESNTVYCYHCRASHPRAEMKLLVTKTGKRWRCIHSIKAVKKTVAERDAFGREITTANKSEGRKSIERLQSLQSEKQGKR